MPNSMRGRLVPRLRAVAALMLALPVAATAAPTEMDFTQDMLARIHKRAPDVKLEISEPLTVDVLDGPQAQSHFNFDRVLAYCQKNDAAACEVQKDDFASRIARTLVTKYSDLTPVMLRVVVRNEKYARQMSAALGSGKDGPLVIAPVAAGVDLMLAADYPDTTRMVNEGDLKSLGMTREEAIALGTKQVIAALPPLPDSKALASRVSMIAGEDYGASYLLAVDPWRERARGVTGILWLAIPADERVIMGVAHDEGELAKLKPVVANDFATAPRGISPYIYRWTSKGWEPVP